MSGNIDKYEQLSAYLDGELTESQRQEVERLLASDAEARKILDELRRTAEMLRALPRPRLTPAGASGLTARLERESLLGPSQGESHRSVSWWRPVAIAAAVLIVCGVGYQGMVRLQEFRERRVFQLADAEYAKSAPPTEKSLKRTSSASPGGPLAVRTALSPTAAPLAKSQVQIASPESAPMSLAGRAAESDRDRERNADEPAEIAARFENKSTGVSPPMAGFVQQRREESSIPIADSNAKKSNVDVLSTMGPKAARSLKSGATSRPTSQPTSSPASAPTTQPTSRGDRP